MPMLGLKGDFPVDDAVFQVLPPGAKLIWAESTGVSRWGIPAKLDVSFPDGSRKSFFLKCADGLQGRTMLWGEFNSISTIRSCLPHFVPTPYGIGKYKEKPPGSTVDRYFSVFEFLDMDVGTPDPDEFTTQLAELHYCTSPNGMFGFDVTTCDGKTPHTVGWEPSWTVFYTKLFKGVLKLDLEANGSWPELEAAAQQLIDQVIPRLLDVLESDGQEIKPSLIHGDLWAGNVGTVSDTGDIVVYDAGSYYAHNEMELGMWRCPWELVLGQRIFFMKYHSKFPQAEPVDEWDDRNRLYALKYNLNYSVGHPKSVARQVAYNDILYLCEKFAPLDELEGYDPQMDPTVTGLKIEVHNE